MKTKRESKFTLEKFEVAKLKDSSMRKIGGGGVGFDDPITGGQTTKTTKNQGGGNG